MKNIALTRVEVRSELTKRLSKSYLTTLDNLQPSDIPKVVYTSFDGDLLSYSEIMKQLVLRRNLTPLNPESALGTYLVVNHYKGNKVEIIRDCISLLSRCDHFWVISNLNVVKAKNLLMQLPEGVVIEAMYWMKYIKPKISVLDLNDSRRLTSITYNSDFENFFLNDQWINIGTFVKRKAKQLKRAVYLLAGEKHSKHADWMRKTAYVNKAVPLCPYTLINMGTLTLAYRDNPLKRMLARISMSCIADEVWIFSPFSDVVLDKFETDLLIELYITLRFYPSKSQKHISFSEAEVPKYVNKQKWSITTRERFEDG